MRLYDTRSRELQDLKPIEGETYRFYCCGPTVYGPAHIGNFRTFVLQDILRRVLELGGMPTYHVRNITDVDDKTIRGAHEAGRPLVEFTADWTERFHVDSDALNCLLPHVEPRATGHIDQQVGMIARLMEKGHAYQGGDGSVYFRIASFQDYGGLSRLDQRELELGRTQNARGSADEYDKDNVADFVLWKARRPEDGDVFWKSPWGEGRPGWHLECSAMTEEYLGKDFDLHSGGVDLVFPHHENEIAQSQCACGGGFAAHWFHITHLLVDGGKMSKSLGNLYTIDDLREKGYSPMEVRYVLASGHYRRPMNFTLDSLSDARAALARLARAAKALADGAGGLPVPDFEVLKMDEAAVDGDVFAAAWESLRDDLNTPEALGHVFSTLKRLRPAELSSEEARQAFLALHRVLAALGVNLPSVEDAAVEVPEEIRELADARWAAKQVRDWGVADRLRDQLLEKGWAIKDGKDGYVVKPA